MRSLDHAISKGTKVVIIYRAMLSQSQAEGAASTDGGA